jgi:hypothetical protein
MNQVPDHKPYCCTFKSKKMEPHPYNQPPEENRMPPAETGNASNPSPHNDAMEPENKSQLIDERGEKYLREISSPEDYPDEQDWEDANKIIGEESKDQ